MFGANDIAVVIPTRDRWQLLAKVLDALADQTVDGFEVIVTVDGTDQSVPQLRGSRVLVNPKGGPGSARNRGVRSTDKAIVLFIGDDVIPSREMIKNHLVLHQAHSDPSVAVLGRTEWHPDVAPFPYNRWLDRTASQFDYKIAQITGEEAGWVRFYSSNVSIKREMFLDTGGFDEAFEFDYEDLDIGYRLGIRGLRLLYAPEAVGYHLHPYDWCALTRRYRSRGSAERQMAEKHDWFEPFFRGRIQDAQRHPRMSSVWPVLADKLPSRPQRLRRRVDERANIWYHQQLAPHFLGAWNGRDDLDDLRQYLRDDFDAERLWRHRELVEEEEAAAPDEATFYRKSEAYLYDLTMFATWGTKEPYLAALERLIPPPARLLDYGCGTGTDGLRLIDRGYTVSFAEFDNPSAAYLKWRLARRGIDMKVYDLDDHVPGGFDVVYSFDVIEHVDAPMTFLDELERRGDLVVVNLLEPDPGDTHLHKSLPIGRILRRAGLNGLVFYHRYGGRSHLIAYRSPVGATRSSLAKSLLALVDGRLKAMAEGLTGLPPRP